MVENTQNSFEWYIGLFTFYIIPINYATFMDQILIFGLNRFKTQLFLFFMPLLSRNGSLILMEISATFQL